MIVEGVKQYAVDESTDGGKKWNRLQGEIWRLAEVKKAYRDLVRYFPDRLYRIVRLEVVKTIVQQSATKCASRKTARKKSAKK